MLIQLHINRETMFGLDLELKALNRPANVFPLGVELHAIKLTKQFQK